MSVQSAIDRLGSIAGAAGAQADLREVARLAYITAQANQAALNGLIKHLAAQGYLPNGPWLKALEAAYVEQAQVLEQVAHSIILAPGGKH